MYVLSLPLPIASLLKKCQTLDLGNFKIPPGITVHLIPVEGSLRSTGPDLAPTSSAPLPQHLLNAPFGPEAPASSLRFDDFCIRVEPLCEALVLATISGWAHLRVTLVLQHSVQALRFQAARVLIGWLAVTAGNLWQVCNLDLYLSYDFVSLENKITDEREEFKLNTRNFQAVLGSASVLQND